MILSRPDNTDKYTRAIYLHHRYKEMIHSESTIDKIINAFKIERRDPVSRIEIRKSGEFDKFWCASCGLYSVRQVRTEWSCDKCGQIMEPPIDETAEWTYNVEETKTTSRCGLPMNPNFPKSSLGSIVSNKKNGGGGKLGKRKDNEHFVESTTIDPFPVDKTHQGLANMCPTTALSEHPNISPPAPAPAPAPATFVISAASNAEYRMRRIQRFQSWNTSNYRERSLFKDFETIQSIASSADLLMIVQRSAMNLFSKVKKAHICRGEAKKGIIAASIFFACKQKGVPRSAREVASFFKDDKITEKVVIKGCKRFEEIWSSIGESPIIVPSTLTSPSDFVERFMSHLNVHSSRFCKLVIDLTDFLYENSLLTESVPQNIAVAVIILLKDEHETTIPDLEEACKLTMTSYSGTKKCFRKLALLPILNENENEKNEW